MNHFALNLVFSTPSAFGFFHVAPDALTNAYVYLCMNCVLITNWVVPAPL